MKTVKNWVVGLVMFLSALLSAAGQGGHVPTTGSNNSWTGINTFIYENLRLNTGTNCTTAGYPSGYVMVGFNANFVPVCVAGGGSGSSFTLNGLGGAVTIATDSNLTVTPNSSTNILTIACISCNNVVQSVQGNTGNITFTGDSNIAVSGNGTNPIHLSCPGCGGSGGGVSSAINAQLTSYPSNGSTVSGAPNTFIMSPSMSLAQMSALFTRSAGVQVTSYTITGNVLTAQGLNNFTAGDVAVLEGFADSSINGNYVGILSTGLSNTQFEVGLTHANASGTTGVATINVPSQPVTSQSLIIIPPGINDNPATAWVNGAFYGPSAQVLDARRGYGLQQASQYGIKCDAKEVYVTLTPGSNQVTIGSSFPTPSWPIGMTMAVGVSNGYGQNTVGYTFVATVTNTLSSGTIAVLSTPYPSAMPTYTGNVLFGTNNQAAIQRAVNDVGGGIPLFFPSCGMLTDTVRWNGASLIGQSIESTNFYGFPTRDIFQQQDTLPITAWSINASTGVTTFTVPAYASQEILPASLYPAGSLVYGDLVTLNGFGTSTFFNNQTVYIATQPSPTTFTVNSAFGQSTSSSTESGKASPTTSVGVGTRVENISLTPNNATDGTYPFNAYNAAGALTVEPAYYRPSQQFNQPMNQPAAPGWGSLTNGVAKIVQNSGVICVPTTSGSRQPTVGIPIWWPYQGAGNQTFMLSSTAGSCTAGYDPYTLASYNGGPAVFPNTAAFTATQAEWWQSTAAPQTLAAAIPATITYPYTIYLNLPVTIIAGWEANVASHGRIIINNDEFEYMGLQYGGTAATSYTLTAAAVSGSTTQYTGTFGSLTCSGQEFYISGFTNAGNNGAFPCTAATSTTLTVTSTTGVAETHAGTASSPAPALVLRTGPTSINGGAGDAKTSVVFPLNPCYAMKDVPWPVVPSINSGQATPVGAVYYAGRCGANAALSLPSADGLNTTFNGDGLNSASLNNLNFSTPFTNALGNSNNNGVMGIWEAGNNTGYDSNFFHMYFNNIWGAFIQGPASVNQHGIRGVGPTSTGQSIANCSAHTSWGIVLINMNQSNIERCDTYLTEISEYDGTAVGNGTGIDIGYSLSEQDGGGVTSTSQFTVKDYNGEPESPSGATHEEFVPSVISDGGNVTWLGDIFEGGYNIFGGSYQHFLGGQMAVPIFNYGANNYFDKLYGVNNGYNDANVYNGTSQFYNWGANSTCQGQTGSAGPLRVVAVGCVQDYNGHDIWSAVFGNEALPTENMLGGMITPAEVATAGGSAVTFDSTENWWGQHNECGIGSGQECVYTEFDGFNGYLAIGSHQRITNAPMLLKVNLKLKTSGSATVRLLVSAQNAYSTTCSPNYSLATYTTPTITSSGWSQIEMPVNFTGYAGCTLGLQIDQGTSTNTVEIGYVNFIPFPTHLYIPYGVETDGNACPVAGETYQDGTNVWMCMGAGFGSGTWKKLIPN